LILPENCQWNTFPQSLTRWKNWQWRTWHRELANDFFSTVQLKNYIQYFRTSSTPDEHLVINFVMNEMIEKGHKLMDSQTIALWDPSASHPRIVTRWKDVKQVMREKREYSYFVRKIDSKRTARMIMYGTGQLLEESSLSGFEDDTMKGFEAGRN
jgi:hypothetical protein